MKRYIYCFSIAFVPFQLAILTLYGAYYVSQPIREIVLLTWITQKGVHIFFEVYFFSLMYFLMRREHDLEFNRTKRSMQVQIFLAVFPNILILLFPLGLFIEIKNPDTGRERGGSTVYVINWIFQIGMLLKCLMIVKIKSTYDILQGINKLDHLVKVSSFQVYKQKHLRIEQQQRIEYIDAHTLDILLRDNLVEDHNANKKDGGQDGEQNDTSMNIADEKSVDTIRNREQEF